MVSKGDLFRSIKLSKLSKAKSFELIFEAIVNSAIIFSINDIKYNPGEVICDLIDVIYPDPFNPKIEFKYGIYHSDTQVCNEQFRETVDSLGSDDCILVIFFTSNNPKFNS